MLIKNYSVISKVFAYIGTFNIYIFANALQNSFSQRERSARIEIRMHASCYAENVTIPLKMVGSAVIRLFNCNVYLL